MYTYFYRTGRPRNSIASFCDVASGKIPIAAPPVVLIGATAPGPARAR
jgi:hypothetical protein